MEIIPWDKKYALDFRDMNLFWLEEFFWVEPHDEEVLGNPEKHIIKPGGTIFFVKENDEIIGCVALMKMKDMVFELTKMAVKPEYRGKKIGHKLMQHTLDYAQQQGWEKLIIYSNRKLENAIHLYAKSGFLEIPLETNGPYTRGDIKMELKLS